MKFFDKRIFSHFNYELIILILPLIYISHTLVGEISEMLAKKQLIYFTLSIIAFVVVFFFPIRRFIRFIMPLYWLGIILLIAVLLFGTTKLGATRWLEIPFVNLTIQPSELFKPVFILALAYLISQKPPSIGGYNLKEFAYFSFYILLPFVLIAKEPDLGTGLVLLLMGYGILFIVGINWRIIIGILVIVGLSSPVIYTYLIKDYQKKRINDFLSKEPSYHVQQSIIAIGSGGLTGKDIEEATQAQLKFLPIATSDFIFAYLVERYGFIGGAGVVLLYLLLIVYLLILTNHYKQDFLISVFASGIGLLIFLDMSVNILMVIGYAPVVGLPLPMFSYGGSSFINFIVIFAILENLLAFRYLSGYELKKKF
jgi:rod shape determining protein RodA